MGKWSFIGWNVVALVGILGFIGGDMMVHLWENCSSLLEGGVVHRLESGGILVGRMQFIDGNIFMFFIGRKMVTY